MSAIVYSRVSTKGQVGQDHVSIPLQEQKVREWLATQHGRNEADSIADVGSGRDVSKLWGHDEILRVIKDNRERIAAGEHVEKITLVAVYSVDRLGRDVLGCLLFIRELKRLGVDIFFVSEGVGYTLTAHKHTVHIALAAAARQSDWLSDIGKSVTQFRRDRGDYIGSAPYGKMIRRVPIPASAAGAAAAAAAGEEAPQATRTILVNNPEEQRVIRKIRTLMQTGKTLGEIAYHLNYVEQVTKRGKAWTRSMVQTAIDGGARRAIQMGAMAEALPDADQQRGVRATSAVDRQRAARAAAVAQRRRR